MKLKFISVLAGVLLLQACAIQTGVITKTVNDNELSG